MSKDWEFINRENAIRILNRIFSGFAKTIYEIEEKCARSVNEIRGPEIESVLPLETIRILAQYFDKERHSDAYPKEIELVDKETRKLANTLIDDTISYLKYRISCDAASKITERLSGILESK
jgi:hypothetical protein